MVVHLDGTNFDAEVLKSNIPVLIDFWAPWCGPCQMVGPVVESLAKEYAGRLKVGKINVDEAADLAGRFSVSGIPMFLIFKDGAVVDTFVGALSAKQLVAKVSPYL